MLNLLFATVSATLLEFGQHCFGAQLVLTLVLDTWGQTLIDHHRLHVLATGEGLSPDHTRLIVATPYYLFLVHALSRIFRGRFRAGLQALYAAGQLHFHGQSRIHRWVFAEDHCRFAGLRVAFAQYGCCHT